MGGGMRSVEDGSGHHTSVKEALNPPKMMATIAKKTAVAISQSACLPSRTVIAALAALKEQ